MDQQHTRHALTPDYVLSALNVASNAEEWNELKNRIKKENGGRLPLFWKRVVIRSGFIDVVSSRWGLNTHFGEIASFSEKKR